MIDRIRGCHDCDAKIDIVVLRASGGAGYNDYLLAMHGVDSVTTFVITDMISATSAPVIDALRGAEYVFFAGGDQCNYVRLFNDNQVEVMLRRLYARGGAIGGTSAGMAILGKAIYDACNDASSQSKNALADPYNDEISFTTDMYDWPLMENVITDTHFAQRDRMGRLFAFLVRQLREPARPAASIGKASAAFPVVSGADRDAGSGDVALGIAANERTAVLVDNRGMAHVFGEGPAYFVLADHFPYDVAPGRPLNYCGFKVWRVGTGLSYDLLNRPRVGFYTADVQNGVILSNPY